MDSRKPLTAGEIEELKQLCANYANPACGVAEADVWKAFNALPRLLSMLEKSYCVGGKNLHGHDCVEWEKRAWDAEARVQELLGEVERLKASTPPTDAAVRDAVEFLGEALDELALGPVTKGHIRTILSAVQAPLPGEVETWDAELEWEEQGGHVCPVVYMRRVHVGQVAEPYVKHSDYADLTRRLAESRARTRRVANRLHVKHVALRKCCAALLEERTRLAEVEAELADMRRQRDVNSGLWQTQKDICARKQDEIYWLRDAKEGTEARVRELEAFKARVMAWASERCICGLVGKACPKGMFDGETKWATSGPCPNWTPPQAWGGEHG